MTNIGIKTHQLTLYALLIAMTTAGRIAFQFIPNMQPMTAMLIIISLNLGIKPGFIITLLTLLAEPGRVGIAMYVVLLKRPPAVLCHYPPRPKHPYHHAPY